MQALQVIRHGTVPRLLDIPVPQPGAGEVSIDIAACGLNFADLLMVSGDYQACPPVPFTLGMEVAGTVRATGPGVTHPPVGSRVAVYAGSGGLAQTGVFPADSCIPLPEAMDMADAAGFQIAYGTSHLALQKAGLVPGQTLLVLGAAGGVGLTAVEVGKLMGARVIACARGPEKLAVARDAGADHTIDSSSEDIRQRVKDLGGADVVYDPVGGDQFTAALRACNRGARMIVIGFASGSVPQVPANIIMVKNITVLGFYWGGYHEIDAAARADSLAQLFDWHAAGKLHPHVSHQLPLDRAAEALELLRARKSTGKVVVTMC